MSIAKPILKINFTDFWSGFDPRNNLFVNTLQDLYEIEVSEDPDFLIYSAYGHEYLNYKCHRLFYTPENRKTSFYAADYSISFENLKNENQYYFPYYAYCLLHFNTVDQFTKTVTYDEAIDLYNTKTDFCCTVVSNSSGTTRNAFFNYLNTIKTVNSGGSYLNNVGGPVPDKTIFAENHRFVFAFENQSYKGYTTEKLTDAVMAKSIPIYYGNPDVGIYFNKKRFLDYSDFESIKDLSDRILEIEDDKDLFAQYICEPIFHNNKLPSHLHRENLLKFLIRCINNSKKTEAIATSPLKYIHRLWIFFRKYIKANSFLRKRILIQYKNS